MCARSYVKERPLKLELSGFDNSVEIDIFCYNKIDVGIVYGDESISIGCREENPIGNSKELKGTTITFCCTVNNPFEREIKVKHIIREKGGNTKTYTFPGDYDGTPQFENDNGKTCYYEFQVKFE
ncbi:MAG: hypothetical protein K9M99_03170 [Candidatus Cloacimonetes bacterium]|nr:hypothetical protein [Candidatus Cloacimonadota bacterium]